MATGYTPDPFVWAHDKLAQRSGPVHRDLVALFPDRYSTDEEHPVVDERGVLLPSKPHAIAEDTAETTNDTAGTAEED